LFLLLLGVRFPFRLDIFQTSGYYIAIRSTPYDIAYSVRGTTVEG